jgi:hypothetical protein
MHATVAMQAWPATGPCPFSFIFLHHREFPLGPAHLCVFGMAQKPSRPIKSFENLISL